MVETVDSEKLAQALNNSWSKQSSAEPLAVMLQVNTSKEESECVDTLDFFVQVLQWSDA